MDPLHGPSSSSSIASTSSSPTTSSFYRPGSARRRQHHSQSSSRTSFGTVSAPSFPLFPTSQPRSLHTRTLEAARLARQAGRPPRDLAAGEGVWGEDFAPGGLRGGVWEEYTEEEERKLGREIGWETRRRREILEEQFDEWPPETEEEELDDDGNFPPSDLDDYPSYTPPGTAIPLVPSLASDSQGMDIDDLPRSSPPPLPPPLPLPSEALPTSECPSCSQALPSLDAMGLHCPCGWSITHLALDAIDSSFAQHAGDCVLPQPVVTWDIHMGTMIFCEGCDEQWAA